MSIDAACLGLLDLSQQYMDWVLKRKLEDLIRAQLTTDNVADFYVVATQFEAKVQFVDSRLATCNTFCDTQIMHVIL